MKLYAATLVDETKPKRARKKQKKEEPVPEEPPKEETVQDEVANSSQETSEEETVDEKPIPVEKTPEPDYTKLYKDLTRLEEAISSKSVLPDIDYESLMKVCDKFTEYERQLDRKLQLLKTPPAPKKKKRIVYQESDEEDYVPRKRKESDDLYRTIFGDR